MNRSALTDGQDDSIIDRRLGILLRTGVILSGLVVLIGGVMLLFESHGHMADYRTFHGVPENLTSVSQIIVNALRGDASAIIQSGLLLLIATPVARVVLSVVAFAMERDVLYVAISVVVLCILLCSILW